MVSRFCCSICCPVTTVMVCGVSRTGRVALRALHRAAGRLVDGRVRDSHAAEGGRLLLAGRILGHRRRKHRSNAGQSQEGLGLAVACRKQSHLYPHFMD